MCFRPKEDLFASSSGIIGKYKLASIFEHRPL